MTVTIARRLIRASWVRRIAVVITLATALLVTAVITMAAFSLSAQQAATRDLGRFDAQVHVSATIRPGSSPELTTLSTASSDGSLLTLTSSDLTLPTRAGRSPTYVETNWAAKPYPGLSLRSGRWPQKPGEVALGGTNAIATGRAGQISILERRVKLTVVGTVRDQFGADDTILAAPGTWASLPRGVAERASTNLNASPVFLTDELNLPRVTAVAKRVGGITTIHRADVRAEPSWIAESPFSFTVPALLVPAIAAASVIGAAARPGRRFVRSTSALGLPARAATQSVFVAFALMAVLGGSVGVVIGLASGAGARVVVQHFTSQAVGPYPNLLAPVATIAASTAVGLLIGVRLLRPSAAQKSELRRTAPQPTARRRSMVWPSVARRSLSVIMVCLSIFLALRVSDVTSLMIFAIPLGIAWALVVPDVLGGCARVMDNRSPRARLAARMIRGHLGSASMGAILTTVLLTLTTTTVVLLTATGSSARSDALGEVPPGQVGIGSVGGLGQPAPVEVQKIARQTLTYQRLIRVDSVQDAMYVVTQGSFGVSAVPTVGDLEKVAGVRLATSQRATLEGGGVLAEQRGFPLSIRGTPAGAEIPVDYYRPAPEWGKHSGAVMLTSTARQLHLKLEPGGLIAAGVSREKAELVRDRVSAAGLDSKTVRLYRPPTALLPPGALVASALLLAVLLLVITYAAGRSQAAGLRRQMQRLVAIGAGPGFARRTQVTIQAVVTGIGLMAALAIGGIAVAVLLLSNRGVRLNPPVLLLFAIVVAVVAANLVVIVFATRNLDGAAAREG